MNVFQAIDAAFQQPAIQFLERTASGLCSALADPMRAALTLYVLWFGILVLRGAVQEPIPDALARIFKASIITTLTLSYASYNDPARVRTPARRPTHRRLRRRRWLCHHQVR